MLNERLLLPNVCWWLQLRPLMLLSACLLISGCDDRDPKEGLVPAYGTVTLDGEPLVDAQVTFNHPENVETFGRTDSNGYYEMAYTFSQKGAFAGTNAVSFTTADKEVGKEERVPSQYLEGKSVLTTEVTDGGAPYNFALTSLGSENEEQSNGDQK